MKIKAIYEIKTQSRKEVMDMKAKVTIFKVKIGQIKNFLSVNDLKAWQNMNITYDYESDVRKDTNWKELSNYNYSITKLLFLTVN